MDDTTEYPFDTDGLAKGDTVAIETLERAYSVTRGTEAYQFAWMQAKAFVVRRFADRGEVITVVYRDGDLVILTDEGQVEYNAESFRRGIRTARRAHSRMLGADRSKIADAKALEMHDRRLEVQGRVLGAVARESRVPALAAATRTAPALPGSRDPADNDEQS